MLAPPAALNGGHLPVGKDGPAAALGRSVSPWPDGVLIVPADDDALSFAMLLRSRKCSHPVAVSIRTVIRSPI
jgi:hypothetical protein